MHADQQLLAAYFDSEPLPDLLSPSPRFNIAPATANQVILEMPPLGEVKNVPRHSRLMRWGLIPSWAGPNSKIKPINARAESAHEKPMFRHLFKRNRCLIPISGWYEWQRKGEVKRPFFHYHREAEPLGIAALWSGYSSSSGDYIESFTMLTTQASDEISKIHHRMPVLVNRENWSDWFSVDTPLEMVREMVDSDMVHSASVNVDFHEVSRDVNYVKKDGEPLIHPI